MHIYQKHILDLLRQTPSLRYSQLQPDGVESSHFKYHLNQLLKDGLVTLQSRGIYALTTAGESAVDRLSGGKINPHLTPKVITYTLLKDADSYYLQRKQKQPYLGLYNMIGGKVHLGESTSDAALREVFEKTGHRITQVSLRAVAEIKINQNDALLSHVIAYIYTAHTVESFAGLTKVQINDLRQISDPAPDLLPILNALGQSDTLQALHFDINI